MSEKPSFFVTSTGTDIGKTIASRAFLDVIQPGDGEVGYFKSVASGCESSDWGYRSPDEVEIIESGHIDPDDVTASLRFEAPLSPDRAAEREGRSFTIEDIIDRWVPFRERFDRTLVEGIGGVAVPFNESEDVADLIRLMDLPAVIIAQSTLGTISYTRTAVNFLRDKGCEIRGILLSPEEGRDIERINRDHLRSIFPGLAVNLLPNWNQPTENAKRNVKQFLESCDLF